MDPSEYTDDDDMQAALKASAKAYEEECSFRANFSPQEVATKFGLLLVPVSNRNSQCAFFAACLLMGKNDDENNGSGGISYSENTVKALKQEFLQFYLEWHLKPENREAHDTEFTKTMAAKLESSTEKIDDAEHLWRMVATTMKKEVVVYETIPGDVLRWKTYAYTPECKVAHGDVGRLLLHNGHYDVLV